MLLLISEAKYKFVLGGGCEIPKQVIVNNYSPNWRWLVNDYPAKSRGILSDT